jgi:transcription initiation factor TFIID subunit 11
VATRHAQTRGAEKGMLPITEYSFSKSLTPGVQLVNQTLSQSVPQTVVTAVVASTRVFVGELVDKACEVRDEWQAASRRLPTGEDVNDNESIEKKILPENRGPVTPDQLREALRRVRKERDGATPGMMGFSLSGLEITAPKMNGKRLFR